MPSALPDEPTCRSAVRSRDARFDGWFVMGVTSTGIYCRPSCPARTPRDDRMRFYPSTAAAQTAGFRACLRCRPDASPGSPARDVRSDVSDPVAVDAALARDYRLRPLVARTPGRRVPRTVDPEAMALRAVIGQQVSTSAARTDAGRLITALGHSGAGPRRRADPPVPPGPPTCSPTRLPPPPSSPCRPPAGPPTMEASA